MDQSYLYWYEKMLFIVGDIIKKYDYNKEITGEDFNLFQIIRFGHEEVQVHSAFIAELLDVNGRHKMGDVFQKLFVEEIISKVENLDIDNIKSLSVFVEKVIDTESRLDICMENSEYCFVIENKIYAQDQAKQLERYFGYVEKKDPKKRHIFYLTLYGHEPSEQSVGKVNENEYSLISYKNHIIDWLEKCCLKAIKKPYVRENISQYLDLVRQLTNSVEATAMNQIKESILKNMNIEAIKNFPVFIEAVESMQNEYALKFFNELSDKYKSFGWNIEEVRQDFIKVSDVKNTKKWERRGYVNIKMKKLDFEIWSSFSSAEENNCKCSWFQSHLRIDKIKDTHIKNKIIELLKIPEFQEIGTFRGGFAFQIFHTDMDILKYYEWYNEKKREALINEISGKVKSFLELFESKIEEESKNDR